MFFVEAHDHHSPKRAADQVRYIAHREEGLREGERRELYGIGPRYRAFRGDERLIRKALIEDARGLRNPVYFRFILTVDNRTADRFARLDGHLTERVLRDAVEKTFRGTARPVSQRLPSSLPSAATRRGNRDPRSIWPGASRKGSRPAPGPEAGLEP